MRREPRNKLLTLEDELSIVSWYKNGISAVNILAKLNKVKTTKSIYDTLEKHGVSRRIGNGTGDVPSMRDPLLRHDYFSCIDSPSKAYALGLMVSDGWVVRNANGKNPQIALSLVEDDRYMISWLKTEWQTNNMINRIEKDPHVFPSGVVYQSRPQYRIVVTSKRMFQDLDRLGIDCNKSNISILPSIDRNLYSHLLRGIIDGDGTIGGYEYGGSTSYLSVRFLGSLSLVAQISWYLHDSLGLAYLKPKIKTGTLASIDYMVPNEVDRLAEYIYRGKEEANYLERKYRIYADFKRS